MRELKLKQKAPEAYGELSLVVAGLKTEGCLKLMLTVLAEPSFFQEKQKQNRKVEAFSVP